MSTVYIGLGGNVGDSKSIFKNVVSDLSSDNNVRVDSISSCYVTKPLDNMQQPDYLNAVMLIDTQYSPHELLIKLQSLETRYGRVRTGQNWTPRTLDLDIILYEDCIINTPSLVVPHPGMLQRDFVLYPLYEISPRLEIPGFGPILKSLGNCENRGMKKLDEHND